MVVAASSSIIPEVGQAVRVRNRLATVRAVEPYDSRPSGRLHLVEVEYLDDCRFPEGDHLLWEAEATATVLGTTSLPSVDAHRPDSPMALQAFVNAHRWTRLNRLRSSDGIEDEPLLGVWNSAIQVHPYQLEPVLRALQMPRVSLLLADGVGLGKTIQSGLVLEELLLRRRIRRILVLCPAMLQRQWKYELRRKFNVDFEVIDSDSTFQLRRRLGIDTNPWKAFPRIITSMDYLRMPDVLQQFLQASGAADGATTERVSPHAAWDLLIVDEAHHFAPQAGNRASQRTRMLREIRFLFEHRIFASATPHNGKTVCFTGLLELLDPIRFQMTVEMDAKDKEHLAEVRIRRLKEDINKHSLRPPFAEQLPPVELPIQLSQKEANLYATLREYRKRGQAAFGNVTGSERWLGMFIFSLMTKRLLSCPLAFARTWWRHLDEDEAEIETGTLFDMARISAEKAEEQSKTDDEKSLLEEDAARYAGAWLRGQGKAEDRYQTKVNQALEALGFDRKTVEDPGKLGALAKKSDSKTEALVAWVKKNLFKGGKLRDDERLIVFTEYKETLFYLEQCFRQEGFDENTLRLLYGGMNADEFETVKEQFEDPTSAVRLLLATDAASEGINMQESCRWIVHYDIPWSPSRIQQRNGRVSRYGQVRDVSVHYFRCDQDEDMEFLFYVAQKVEQVREDLGSVERVFDAAIQRHFQGTPTTEKQLSLWIEQEKEKSAEKKDLGLTTAVQIEDLSKRAKELLESTDLRLGISPQALVDILRAAVAVEGQGSLEEIAGNTGFYRLKPPPRWEGLARQTLSVTRADRMELVFDARHVTKDVGGREVLRLKKYQVLMRLGHPIMRQAMSTLCRQLHDPTAHDPVYRWSVAALPRSGFEALLIFHFTTTAINELREPLHDDVQSVVFRVEADELRSVEKSFQQTVLGCQLHPLKSAKRRDEWVRILRGRWFQHRGALEAFLRKQEAAQKTTLQQRADVACEREVKAAKESYQYRLKELQDRSRDKELEQLAVQLTRQRVEAAQPTLFEDFDEGAKLKVREIEEQMAILQRDMERTRELVTQERDHRLKVLLPKRFQLREVRVLPLALEYVIPASAEDLKP